MSKMSIRFYKDYKVRAVWDEENNHWWFSVLDIVGAINQQDNHEKNRNYWKYLKSKLRKEQSEVVSNTTQLKLTAADGKKYNTDVISQSGVDKLAKAIRNQQAMDFLDWSKKDYLDAMIASQTDSSRIHKLLKGALTDKIDDREIFMRDIADLLEDAELSVYVDGKPVVSSNKDEDKRINAANEGKKCKKVKPAFKFHMVGLKVGDTIIFDALNLPIKIASDEKIEHEGRLWSLSAFTAEFLPEEMQNTSGAYQGPKYFSCDGKVLSELRKEKEKQ